MDALASFTHLADSLPGWTARLVHLSSQVAERHAEFTRLSKPAVGSASRKRTGSTESLRPDPDRDPAPTSAPLAFAVLRVDVNPDNRHLFRDFREKRLKRLFTSIRSGASGPPRFRSRTSSIVYYDSCIQDDFQWLVRNIAGARNNLRKGKTAASFKARMASLGMDESPFAHGDTSLRNPNLPRLAKSRVEPYKIETGGSDAFELVDKDLEAAQTLCEVGAHQFLRDGTCDEELGGTKERFDNCLRLAREQVAILQQEAKAEAEAEAEAQARRQEADRQPYTATFDLALDPILAAPQPPDVDGHTGHLSGIIEIDSNDSNGIPIDLSAFRSTRRSRAPPDTASPAGMGMIEIDRNAGNDVQIDLTAFRSTRRSRHS
jgi:hypothetical protein